MTDEARTHEYSFPDKLWHKLLKQRAGELGIEGIQWDIIEDGNHWLGVERMLVHREYELAEVEAHAVKDREALHMEDCPMTNSNPEARLECVCVGYPSSWRTTPEGGD